MREIEQLPHSQLHAVVPLSLPGEALHHLHLHLQWLKLVRFLENGVWPLDSNPVENAIRPIIGGRRSWLFANTVGGATASVNLYPSIETTETIGIKPYDYLVALFRKSPLAKTADDYEALLPWNIERGTA